MESTLKSFILLFLVNYSVQDRLPIYVSTVPSLQFTFVRSLITGPTGDLIIIESHSIFNVGINADPPTKNLIAGKPGVGADKRGYREGTGENARFTNPFDLKLKNETTLLVADTENDCLRTVNLLTLSTAPYAGKCLEKGFNDGNRQIAKFNRPAGMLERADRTYIIDFGNQAIRVLETDFVTTLYAGSLLNNARYFTAYICTDETLYLTVFHGIVRASLRNVNVEMISGSSRAGFINSDLQSSIYNNPTGITNLNEHTLAVAGWRNAHLRIVDLLSNKVDSVCSGVHTQSVDGNRTHCSFRSIWNVFVYGESLLIGDLGLIRRLPLYSIIDVIKSAGPIQRVAEGVEAGQAKVFINKPIFKSDQAVIRSYWFIAEEVGGVFGNVQASINKDLLTGYGQSRQNNMPYYIAGEITPDAVDRRTEFSFGDNAFYMGYHNVRLNRTLNYKFHYLIQYQLDGETLSELVESSAVFNGSSL